MEPSADALQKKEEEQKQRNFHTNRLESLYNKAIETYGQYLEDRSENPEFVIGDNVLLNVYESNYWRGGPKQYYDYIKVPYDTLYTVLSVHFDTYWLTDKDNIHRKLWYDILHPIYDCGMGLDDDTLFGQIHLAVFKYFSKRKTDAIGWVYTVEPVDKSHKPWIDASETVLLLDKSIKGSQYLRLLKLQERKKDVLEKIKELEERINGAVNEFK